MSPRLRRTLLQACRPIIAVLATGVYLLSPTAASAHPRARLESGVGQGSATAPLPQSTSTPPATPPTSTEPPAGSSGETPREARRARRLARSGTVTGAGCGVALQATASKITPGTSLSFKGTLSCPETTSAAEEAVTLYQKLAHTPSFAIAATTTTAADGTFQLAAPELQASSVFYAGADGAESARVGVTLTPLVLLSVPAAGTQLFIGAAHAAGANSSSGDAVTFSGTVSPSDAGATVTLQREFRPGAWHRIGVGQVEGEGRYSILHTFARPGEANLRVVLHSHGRYVRSVSAPVSYLISRRRDRQVTIHASVNPLAYGAQVRISGTLAGAVNEPVTLLAQVPGGAFTPVAQDVSAGGEYAFTESPLQSTRYRVSGASASSATLSEIVTSALTPDLYPSPAA
jgi:hypothetical protein